jgi:hypothetical protein
MGTGGRRGRNADGRELLGRWEWGYADTILDPGIATKSYIRIKESIPAVL